MLNLEPAWASFVSLVLVLGKESSFGEGMRHLYKQHKINGLVNQVLDSPVGTTGPRRIARLLLLLPQ